MFLLVPSTEKQRANEKRSRQSDVSSDLMKFDILLEVNLGTG